MENIITLFQIGFYLAFSFVVSQNRWKDADCIAQALLGKEGSIFKFYSYNVIGVPILLFSSASSLLSITMAQFRCEIFGFFLLSFPQNERKIYYFCSVCIFFQGIVFTFQILNDRIHNYVVFFDIIVNFIIQKLKSKRTSLNIQTEQN